MQRRSSDQSSERRVKRNGGRSLCVIVRAPPPPGKESGQDGGFTLPLKSNLKIIRFKLFHPAERDHP